MIANTVQLWEQSKCTTWAWQVGGVVGYEIGCWFGDFVSVVRGNHGSWRRYRRMRLIKLNGLFNKVHKHWSKEYLCLILNDSGESYDVKLSSMIISTDPVLSPWDLMSRNHTPWFQPSTMSLIWKNIKLLVLLRQPLGPFKDIPMKI